MDYNDMAKTVNEQMWKFAQLLIALSIGVIAFSLTNLSNTDKYQFLLYISWFFLLISFVTGIVRIIEVMGATSRGAINFYKKSKGQNIEFDIVKFEKSNKRGAYMYWIMIISFSLGFIAYAIFKILNMTTNIQ